MPKLFFYPVLKALDDGRIVRKAISFLLRILAIAALVGCAYLLIELLKGAFRQGAATEQTMIALLFALILAALGLTIAQIFWYRADSVAALGDSAFTVVPAFSLVIRAIGEMFGAFMVTSGLVLCLAFWIGGAEVAQSFRMGMERSGVTIPGGFLFTLTDSPFLLGVFSLLAGIIFAVLYLLFFYFVSEIMVAVIDIAKNVRLLLNFKAPPAGVPMPQMGPMQPMAGMPPMPPAGPAVRYCPVCSAELQPGSQFCGVCGQRM